MFIYIYVYLALCAGIIVVYVLHFCQHFLHGAASHCACRFCFNKARAICVLPSTNQAFDVTVTAISLTALMH